jgi:hypothetical protein
MGIEPTYSAWKAAALPLSYTRDRPRPIFYGIHEVKPRQMTA